PLTDKGRKLQIETDDFFAVFAKGVDVATYVEHGIADLGIVGEDILLEFEPDVYDLLPLPFGKCRLAIAGEAEGPRSFGKQRIATKFPNITTKYFRERGKSVDIVKLEGSVE
ncbi:ATP phosphoribosyltransferase, partial [Staphylococcus epidermidis]